MSLYVHKLNDEGKVEYQGKVVEVTEKTVKARLFSFLDGSMSDDLKEFDKSMRLAFYETAEEMRRNFERISGYEKGSTDSPWRER
jgi:hypothetical protein